MVTVPAFVWRGVRVRRGLTVGLGVAIPLAALAWLDSGMWLSAVLVLIILSIFYGIWMTRRMARYWPGADNLSGESALPWSGPPAVASALQTRGSLSPSSIMSRAARSRGGRSTLPLGAADRSRRRCRDSGVGRHVRHVGQRDRLGHLPRAASPRTVLVAEAAGAPAGQRRPRRGDGPREAE